MCSGDRGPSTVISPCVASPGSLTQVGQQDGEDHRRDDGHGHGHDHDARRDHANRCEALLSKRD